VNLKIKMSKTLNHWPSLLASYRFYETQYLHFTTRVFGHSAITTFLGGGVTSARGVRNIKIERHPVRSCEAPQMLISNRQSNPYFNDSLCLAARRGYRDSLLETAQEAVTIAYKSAHI